VTAKVDVTPCGLVEAYRCYTSPVSRAISWGYTKPKKLRLEFLMAVTAKVDVTPCSLVESYRYFRIFFFLRHKDRYDHVI